MNALLDTIKGYTESPEIYEDGDMRHFVESFLYKEPSGIWEMRKQIHTDLLEWAAVQIYVTGCDEDLAKELASDLLSVDVYEQRLISAIFDVAHKLDEEEPEVWDEFTEMFVPVTPPPKLTGTGSPLTLVTTAHKDSEATNKS